MGKKRAKTIDFDGSTPLSGTSTRKGIIIVLLIALAILSLLSIFDLAGSFGRSVYHVLRLIFGWGFWIFPMILLLASYFSLYPQMNFFQGANWVGMALTVFGYSGLFHLIRSTDVMSHSLSEGSGGGYLGYLVLWPFLDLIGMGRWGSLVAMIAMLVIGLLLLLNTTLENLIERVTLKTLRQRIKEFLHYRRLKKLSSQMEEQEPVFEGREVSDAEVREESTARDNEEEKEQENNLPAGEAGKTKNPDEGEEDGEEKKVRKQYPKIVLPIGLLNDKASKPTAGDINFCQEKIKKTLSHFGIEVEMGDISIGPTVTQYTFRPADGVKLARIVGLSNDLALALAAHPIRIEAPIPGKSLVGIEVPNKKIAIVPLRQVLESQEFKERKSNLTVVLGQDVSGKSCIADLTRLPHLLVAGATNSGKTVCLNSIIISLLYQNQPDELKFILVDPKRVEMTGYDNIPYLLTPVITEVKKTINSLKWTISEMERRFHVLSHAGKRNIQSYNVTHPNDKLPYIVFIIDELADLMSMAGPEVEAAIIRLAQMARAVGIHLILATQRPSVDIITGLIKANIPGRIAFSVASLTDSRTILDSSGAEKLLGRGDMLYTSAELSKPKRIQGAFCSDDDIENVTDYLRKAGSPDYVDEVTEKANTMGLGGVVLNGEDDGEGDDMLDEARELVLNERKASASYLQRRLRIGYARAARILDLLEQQGIVGPADGAKPREILIKKGERDEAQEYIEEQEIKKSRNQEINEEEDFENEEEEDEENRPAKVYNEENFSNSGSAQTALAGSLPPRAKPRNQEINEEEDFENEEEEDEEQEINKSINQEIKEEEEIEEAEEEVEKELEEPEEIEEEVEEEELGDEFDGGEEEAKEDRGDSEKYSF